MKTRCIFGVVDRVNAERVWNGGLCRKGVRTGLAVTGQRGKGGRSEYERLSVCWY